LNFEEHKNKPPKIQKEGENLAQIEVFSPFPTAFHLVSGIGGTLYLA
jgi:hypothetical protein